MALINDSVIFHWHKVGQEVLFSDDKGNRESYLKTDLVKAIQEVKENRATFSTEKEWEDELDSLRYGLTLFPEPGVSQYLKDYQKHFYDRLAAGKKPQAVAGWVRRKVTGNARQWAARYTKSLISSLKRVGWVECKSVKGGKAFEPPKIN